jgi:predicted GNAT family acetyltransferase
MMRPLQPQPALQIHADAAAFLAIMEPHLLAEEARNGLMLGIALRVRDQPTSYGDALPYFATFTEAGRICAAALITPPFGVVLYGDTQTSDAALDAIAADLAARRWILPSAIGPDPLPARFAACWSARTGVPHRIGVRERTFALYAVQPPRPTTGKMRAATPGETALVQAWFIEFSVEAQGENEIRSAEETRRYAADAVAQGRIFLWEDGMPVSMAGLIRPTPHGIAIGPVYTPPAQRGRGYASSLVAALSGQMLAQGRTFVTLFTDLSNPTSNHIYQSVGYAPVCDYTLYRFVNQSHT